MRGASTRTGTRARRRLAVTLLVAVAVAAGPAPDAVGEITARDERFTALINDARAAIGLASLPLSRWLSRIARRHSERMAERGELFHTNLIRVLSGRSYDAVAENVGAGSGLDAVATEMLASSAHLDNILNTRWRRTGVGVVRSAGRVWVTQIFYD